VAFLGEVQPVDHLWPPGLCMVTSSNSPRRDEENVEITLFVLENAHKVVRRVFLTCLFKSFPNIFVSFSCYKHNDFETYFHK